MSSHQEDESERFSVHRLSRHARGANGHDTDPPEHVRECLRILRVIRKLLRRDMERNGLSLRRAAREGRISVGTLSSFVNGSRLLDPAKLPKRPVHRGTLLHLRAMAWISQLTAKTLDRLLSATAR